MGRERVPRAQRLGAEASAQRGISGRTQRSPSQPRCGLRRPRPSQADHDALLSTTAPILLRRRSARQNDVRVHPRRQRPGRDEGRGKRDSPLIPRPSALGRCAWCSPRFACFEMTPVLATKNHETRRRSDERKPIRYSLNQNTARDIYPAPRSDSSMATSARSAWRSSPPAVS